MSSPPLTYPKGGAVFPDPVVSANLYAAGYLDAALGAVVHPLRRDLSSLVPSGVGYIWTMRYARGGEHLKIRYHGPPESTASVARALAHHAEAFLAGRQPSSGPRLTWPEAPPLDPEDDVTTDHPDLSFLPTSYRPSAIALGGEPYLSLETYRSRITQGLAAGCGRVLDGLAALTTAPTTNWRHRIMLGTIVTALAAMRCDREKAVDYLAFHRDWLIRFPLMKQGADQAMAEKVLSRYRQQAEVLSPIAETLRSMVHTRCTGETPMPDGEDQPWSQAIFDLHSEVAQYRQDPDYDIDAFTSDSTYSSIFKCLHGVANQVGLRRIDEGLTYHLLLLAATDDPARLDQIEMHPWKPMA